MVIVEDEVADNRRRNETRKGENIRNRIDILMRGELSKDF